MNQFRLATRSLILVGLFSLAACNMASSNTTKAVAILSASSQVPPNTSAARGKADVKIDIKSDKLSWDISYSGLSGAVTKAHFHGPADEATNADVAMMMEGDMLSLIKGEATITNEQKMHLLDNKWYINLHTVANPDGEIRGQIIVKQ